MGGDKLYVPVANLHLVSRYTGADNESAPWHKLGSDTWAKVKQKAAERGAEMLLRNCSMYMPAEKPNKAYTLILIFMTTQPSQRAFLLKKHSISSLQLTTC